MSTPQSLLPTIVGPAMSPPITFHSVEEIRAMTLQQKRDYIAAICAWKDGVSRAILWEKVLQPFFDAIIAGEPSNQLPWAAVAVNEVLEVEVPYLTSKYVPVPDVLNALAYVLSTFFQEWLTEESKDDIWNATSEPQINGPIRGKPWVDWMEELVGVMVVIALEIHPTLSHRDTVVIHCLWARTEGLRLVYDDPQQDRTLSSHSQAMGTTLGHKIPVEHRNVIRDRRFEAVREKLGLLDMSLQEIDAFINKWRAGAKACKRVPGGCAEVLPFMAVMMTKPKRPQAMGKVYGFAVSTAKIVDAVENETEPMDALTMRREGYLQTCAGCWEMLGGIGVPYHEYAPGKEGSYSI